MFEDKRIFIIRVKPTGCRVEKNTQQRLAPSFFAMKISTQLSHLSVCLLVLRFKLTRFKLKRSKRSRRSRGRHNLSYAKALVYVNLSFAVNI